MLAAEARWKKAGGGVIGNEEIGGIRASGRGGFKRFSVVRVQMQFRSPRVPRGEMFRRELSLGKARHTKADR